MTLIISWLITLINALFTLTALALLVRVLLPWFRVPPSHPVQRFLDRATEPLVRPLRPPLQGGIRILAGRYVDVAPLAAIFVLWLARWLLLTVLGWFIAPPLWLLQPGADFGRWLTGIINLLFQLYFFIILARLVLEMLSISYAHPVMRFLWNATEPLLAPIRRRVPLVGPLDFSPLVAFILLILVNMVLQVLILMLFG